MKNLILITCIISSIYASEYSDWLASQNQSFNTYKKTLDDEFSDMLKKQWKEYKTLNTPSAFKKEKPKKLPKIKKTIEIPKQELVKSVKIKPKTVIKKDIKKPKTIVKRPIVKYGYSNFEMNFFGQILKIQYDDKFKFNLYNINKKSISKTWQILGQSDFKNLIKQVNSYSKEYGLNDWAKYKLIYNIGLNIYDDKNKSNLFTWFILTKMKYNTKVGYNNNNIYLLANVKEKLYQVSFFTLDNKRFSVLTPSGKISSVGSIYTYPSSYPGSNNKLSFDMHNKEIKIYSDIKYKELEFKYKNKIYKISTKYSRDLIDFYKSFPQSQYNLYYNSKKSALVNNTLLVQLKSLVKDKTELEAVNIILRFVQTSFKYKTDQDQFNYEKVFFPEETLYYEFSDCEDRSIMFSYIVKNLLGLDVVGLKYSDHMSAAVEFSSKIDGDSFMYNNKRYIITDPTYINANVGMTMPQYKNKRFEIIK
jgi:hypothetical protein